MSKTTHKSSNLTKKKNHPKTLNIAPKKYLPDLTEFRSQFSSEGKPLSQIVIEGRG